MKRKTGKIHPEDALRNRNLMAMDRNAKRMQKSRRALEAEKKQRRNKTNAPEKLRDILIKVRNPIVVHCIQPLTISNQLWKG
jgi:hypothetical protein